MRLTKQLTMLAAIGVALLVAASCGEDEFTCLGSEDVIVALSKESVWVYRTIDRNAADSVLRDVRDTISVDRDTLIDGTQWLILNDPDFAWANKPDGFWIWYEYAFLPTEPYLFAKYPASLNERYLIQFAGRTDTMTVSDVLALVRVPYGSFRGYTYRLSDSTGTVISVSQYVPGIGRVRSEQILERHDGDILRTSELLKFTTSGC